MRASKPSPGNERAYVLIVTVMAVALMAVAAVSLLAIARSDFRASNSASGRLRAKIVADAALSDAVALLREHTRYGNYITAVAPIADTEGLPEKSPHLLPEIYRPTWFPGEDPTTKHLIPDNPSFPITGDYLFSLSTGAFNSEPDAPGDDPSVLVESRPRPKDDVRGSLSFAPDTDGDGRGNALTTFLGEDVPPDSNKVTTSSLIYPGTYEVTIPTLDENNAYNFNQRIFLGENESHLVQPPVREGNPPLNALGQWVYTRDSDGRINGRFAFFIEDESMKANADASGLSKRSEDVVAPTSDPQRTEIDPIATLSPSADKDATRAALIASGDPGERLPSARSLPLLDPEWESAYSDSAGFLTSTSKSDLTTARGWKRMDLNSIVAENTPTAAATLIADWIRDAWTGPVDIASLLDHQLYSSDRLRLQVAASIVDYIDPDSTPTDCGDVGGYPVIGIEDVPYINSFAPYIKVVSNDTAARQATFEIRLRFNVLNLYGHDLDLADEIAKIEWTGLPAIFQTGGHVVLDEEDTIFTVEIPGDLDLSGVDGCATETVIPQAIDAEATGRYGYAGVKTFTTKALKTVTVNYADGNRIPTWQANLMVAELYGAGGDRVDVIEIAFNDKRALWQKNTSDLIDAGSEDHIGGLVALTESIVFADDQNRVVDFGDPRYRGTLLNDRWRNWNIADETFLTQTSTQNTSTNGIIDFADQNSRAYAFDFYRYYGDHPKSFHRNGPLINIGELGNVSACEYPWRTLSLQYPERQASTHYVAVKPDVELRRRSALDHVLTDLFKITSADSAEGLININSQKAALDPPPAAEHSLYAGNIARGALVSLFENEPLYKTDSSIREFPPQPDKNLFPITPRIAREFATVLSNRRRDLFASPDVSATAFPWFKSEPAAEFTSVPRPFFHVGESAAPIARALSFGPASSSSDSFSNTRAGYGWNATCTKISYSTLGADDAGGDLSGVSQRTNQGNALVDEALERDVQIEAVFRSISSATTTRGNIFRVLYVGQSGRDFDRDGKFSPNEINAEYLGEAHVERTPVYGTSSTPTPSNEQRTTDSTYTILKKRPVFD